MLSKSLKGMTFIELTVALTLVAITTLASIPLFEGIMKGMSINQSESISAALTMENLLIELSGGRAILHPRAKKGARRSRSLVFLNKDNNIGLIFSDGTYLWLKKYQVATNETLESKLGNCSNIIFHDRGRTRRCLRIRTVLGTCPMATTFQFTNSPRAIPSSLEKEG